MATNVIVGAGQAGAHAAISMREAGFEGAITLVGDEGELPYERPPLSKSHLTADPAPSPSFFFPRTTLDANNIDLMLGSRIEEIGLLSRRLVLQGKRQIEFDRLVLATGSSPRPLTVPGGKDVHVLRRLDDARKLRANLVPGARIVCIGAGVIGLEIAAAARERGCRVIVVERGNSAMARTLPAWVGTYMMRVHAANGVEFLFGVTPVAIEGNKVHLDTEGSISADMVVAGIGILRNTSLAADAGIDVQNGIVVDMHGQTSVPGIYAAGEVAEYYHPSARRHVTQETWRHAGDHGRHVGRAVAGMEESYDAVPWFWSDQASVNLQVAGEVLNAAHTVIRGDTASKAFSAFFLDGGERVVGVLGVNTGRDVSAGLRLIKQGHRVDRGLLANLSVTPQQILSRLTPR